MVDTAYIMKSILRALVGSFKHFVDIYVSKSLYFSLQGRVSS